MVEESVKKLAPLHTRHMEVYGTGNEMRLTGLHETAKFDEFTYGVANRGASIRIPRTTRMDKKGYIEDRRHASNLDPYLVTAVIADTVCCDGKNWSGIREEIEKDTPEFLT